MRNLNSENNENVSFNVLNDYIIDVALDDKKVGSLSRTNINNDYHFSLNKSLALSGYVLVCIGKEILRLNEELSKENTNVN